jgi:nucleoside-diphosphate-sugar epimerase
MERILVTGANGFVGSHLTAALVQRGYQVRCMVRKTSDLRHIQSLPVEWAFADLTPGPALRQACEGVDAVCHCAALTRALDEETFFQVNAQGAEALARHCLEVRPDLQRFLFVSSLAAAGPSRHADDVIAEEDEPRPITWYGKSKLAAERLLQQMDGRLPLTIVRPAAVFGPRDRDFLTYFEVVKHRLRLRLGRHERWASLIYVKDLIDLIVRALESPQALGQTYFGTAYAVTYEMLDDAIARALHKRTIPVTVPEAALTPIALWADIQAKLTGRPALLNDQRVLDLRQCYWLCSGEKARAELGFSPQVDFDRAVDETAAWYLENGWL